jgi:hypothetical protein
VKQTIDWSIALDMLLNNIRDIFNFDAAIPHHVGQNPHRGPQVALALTFAPLRRTLIPRHRCDKRRQQRLRSLGLAVPMLADPDLAGLQWRLTTCQTLCLGRRF